MRKVIWTLVVLTVLAGAAFVADGVLRNRAEERVATEVQQAIPGVESPPDVTIEGFPFVTQLAAARLESVRLTAPTATVEGLRLDDVVVRLRGVTTTAPYTAEHATMTALARPDAISAVLDLDGIELVVRGGELRATASVLGLPLDAALEPRADGHDVLVDVTAFVLAGFRVESSDLPGEITRQLEGLVISVAGLPADMSLTSVRVVPEGIELAAEGRQMVLSARG